MSSPTSASASSCSIRGASWPKGHPTKSFATRRYGRPISVVDPSLSIKGLRAGYGSLDILNGVDLDAPQYAGGQHVRRRTAVAGSGDGRLAAAEDFAR